jgi:hypothetical protein
MLFSKQLLVFVAIISLSAAGLSGCCGSSCDNPDDNKTAPAKKDGEGKQDAAKLTGPAAATYAFLDAARRGDDDKAKGMLTPTAREEITRRGLSVAPPCSDTAKFDVGEVKSVSKTIAHVASRWTDADATGKAQSHEMTWVLRRCDEGWRIGGMATIVFEGEQPLLLNFEKPEELIRQKQMLREEVARRAGQNR